MSLPQSLSLIFPPNSNVYLSLPIAYPFAGSPSLSLSSSSKIWPTNNPSHFATARYEANCHFILLLETTSINLSNLFQRLPFSKGLCFPSYSKTYSSEPKRYTLAISSNIPNVTFFLVAPKNLAAFIIAVNSNDTPVRMFFTLIRLLLFAHFTNSLG